MGASWENIIFVNMGLRKFENVENVCPMYHVFVFCFVFSFLVLGNLSTYFENVFVEMSIEKYLIFH